MTQKNWKAKHVHGVEASPARSYPLQRLKKNYSFLSSPPLLSPLSSYLFHSILVSLVSLLSVNLCSCSRSRRTTVSTHGAAPGGSARLHLGHDTGRRRWWLTSVRPGGTGARPRSSQGLNLRTGGGDGQPRSAQVAPVLGPDPARGSVLAQ
jgi:hypothetical protein